MDLTQKTSKENKMEKEKAKKTEKIAKVNAIYINVSKKYAISICKFIKNRNPEKMIEILKQVQEKKVAIPMHAEVPHRHSMPKGQVAGRYPINASKIFIKLLKSLMANASNIGLNEKELIISTAMTNKAPSQYRGTRMAYGRKKFKRCHVYLEAREIKQKKTKENIK